MYILRDDKGNMKVKLSDRALQMVINNSSFTRKLRKFKSGREVMTITITEDGKIHSGFIDVYLWNGDYIELYEVK